MTWPCPVSCLLETWFKKRRTRRLFGPGYSSDDAGDGPSSDSEVEDEDDQCSTEWGDCILWSKRDIELYLRLHDFSGMITQAYRRWPPEVAIDQLTTLSNATHTAILKRELDGTTRCCHHCKVFRWVHTYTTLPDPWYCFWCYHSCDPKPPFPLESYRVRVNRTIVSDSSVSEFMELLLCLNADIDDSAWYDKEIDFSLPLTTGVDDNGLGWSPPLSFLTDVRKARECVPDQLDTLGDYHIYPITPSLWKHEHLQLYLETQDFSIAMCHAFREWDLETAIQQIHILSYSTYEAIARRVLKGNLIFCDECNMFRWGDGHSRPPDPWYCAWCYAVSPTPRRPIESFILPINKREVAPSLVRDFSELICHLNGESVNSAIDALPIDCSVDEQVKGDGGWAPSRSFLATAKKFQVNMSLPKLLLSDGHAYAGVDTQLKLQVTQKVSSPPISPPLPSPCRNDGVESDGDEYTPADSPLGMETAWTLPIIEAYLCSHDFSFVTIWAMSHLDPFNAERHLNLLSAATHIAVEAQVLEGTTTYCGACKMFLWAHTHTHN